MRISIPYIAAFCLNNQGKPQDAVGIFMGLIIFYNLLIDDVSYADHSEVMCDDEIFVLDK